MPDPVFYPDVDEVWNSFDDLGALVGVKRLPTEENNDYRGRILKAYNEMANSTILGLVFGMNRSLGLTMKNLIEIEPAAGVDRPNMIVEPTRIYIHTGYVDDETSNLCAEIPLYHQDFITIKQVVDAVDGMTSFSATLLDSDYQYYPSYHLVPDTMQKIATTELAAGGRVMDLGITNLVDGSFLWDANDALSNEVDTVDDLTKDGDFHIDYSTGILQTFSPIHNDTAIAFKYYENPFRIRFSSIGILPVSEAIGEAEFYDTNNLPGDELLNMTAKLKHASRYYWGP